MMIMMTTTVRKAGAFISLTVYSHEQNNIYKVLIKNKSVCQVFLIKVTRCGKAS